MKVGIVGLPQSGKRTLFKLLSGVEVQAACQELKSVPGIADIRDARFDSLAELYEPEKLAPAQIDMELLPDIDRRMIQDGDVFKDIANLDALCLVVRSFRDEAIYHVNGSVDPERDIDEINGEFVLHDLLFIEKRLERIALNIKKGIGEQQKKEEILLQRLREHLEKDLPLRTCEMPEDEMKIIAGYSLLTLKQLVIVLNVDDHELDNINLKDNLEKKFQAQGVKIMQISAKLESEIEGLESDEERNEFMEASGILESAINLMSQLCMDSLGLISFFTVGKDEVRQWLVREGSLAPEAAGVIHSDIQRGFIRAEVMKYEDLIHNGSEDKVKQAGKHYVMGKDYPIVDGDIVSYRFNV